MRDIVSSARLRALFSAALLAAWLAPAPAAADLPPPDGTKFVTFHIAVTGLADHKDHVLLVSPWSLSNGAPTEEIAELSEGKKLPFGRRVMGTPKIWSMRRDAYEANKAELKLPAEGAVDCGVTINMRSVVPKDAPDELVDRYRVAELGDGVCKLEAVTGDAAKPAPADGPKPGPGPAPNDGTPPGPSTTGDAPAPQGGSGGCASCGIGRETSPSWPAALLLGLGLTLGARRRRR